MAGSSIPVSVDQKFQVTRADDKLAMDKAFDDVFGPLDDRKPPEPPPKEPALEAKALETDRQPPKPEPETLPGTEPADRKIVPELEPTTVAEDKKSASAKHPDDDEDEELDKYQLHPAARPDIVDNFREVRGKAKAYKKQLSDIQAKLKSQETELGQLKTTVRPVSDPTVQKEIEELRSFRQRHQIWDDSTFQNQFEAPVRKQFDEIIADIKGLSPDKGQADAWEAEVRKYGPERLDKKYWNEGVIQQLADPLDRDRVVRKISTLLDLQNRRNTFAAEVAQQPDKYQQFQHEQAANYWKNFSVEAEDEANKIVPTLGEWALEKDVSQAKSQSERAAIEAHNKAYADRVEKFKAYITDAATQGPRGMTRVAIAALEGQKYKADYETAQKQMAKLQAQLAAANEELNKIASARSRPAQASGAANGAKAPDSSGGTKKAGQSLTSAFDDFFGKT
jgi:hypothetical protein